MVNDLNDLLEEAQMTQEGISISKLKVGPETTHLGERLQPGAMDEQFRSEWSLCAFRLQFLC